MYADYVNDIALLASTPTRTESFLHSLEQVAGGMGQHRKVEMQLYVI